MSADGVFNNPGELNGLTAYDRDGNKIGNVGQIYVDDRTGRPEWVTVKTGLFGMKESLVPLEGARRRGQDLHVPHTKDTVKDAPRLDADEHLDPPQEKQLYQHYGLTNAAGTGMGTRMDSDTDSGMAADAGANTGADTGTGAGTNTDAGMAAGTGAAAGAGAGAGMGAATGMPADAGMRGEPAMRGSEAFGAERGEELIRSEEQLRVGTEEHESGRARLRKVVVTENVTTTVPISHEEVRVVHEPISPEDRREGRSMPIGEAETEVTLHAEQPVIRKDAVAVERVRMETERVTEEREVSSDVRKEQIEYESGEGDPGMGETDMGGKRGPSH